MGDSEGEPTGRNVERRDDVASRGLAFWASVGGLIAVLVIGVLPFAADAKSEARTPTSEDLSAAVLAVRTGFEPGDAVQVEPTWWTLPWQGLVQMGKGTESWPFPALMISEEIDPIEALGHRRIFVLAGFAREPVLPPLVAASGVARVDIFRSPTVNAAVWELDRAERLRSLMSEWENLVVERRRGPDADKQRCGFQNGKHRCHWDSWLDVAPEPRVVERREVVWLFTHPGPNGSELELTWNELPTQGDKGATWLYVRVGPSLEAVRHPEGGPVLFETFVDDELVDAVVLEPRAFRMQRRAIRLGGELATASVSFRITSEDAAWREVMMTADVVDHLPVALREWATVVIER